MVLEIIKLFVWTVWTTKSILLISVSAGIGNLSLSYDGDVMPDALLSIYDEFKSIDQNEDIQWLIVSSPTFGAIIGAMFATWSSDMWGRRTSILIADILSVFASLVTASSINFRMLIFGRFVFGTAVGILSMTVPLYISEFSPPQIRGILIGLNSILGGLGRCFSSFFIKVFGTWRWTVELAIIFPLLQFFMMWQLPDTPPWLLRQGMAKERKKTLKIVREALKYIYPPDQRKEVLEIMVNSIQESPTGGNVNDSFFLKLRRVWGNRRVWRNFLAGIFVQVASQAVGLDSVVKFSPHILQYGGYEADSVPAALSKIITTVGVLASVLCLILVETVGRKKLVVYSLKSLSAIFLALSSGYYVLEKNGPHIVTTEFSPVFSANNTCWALDCADCLHSTCGFCTVTGRAELGGACLKQEDGSAICRASNGQWFDLGCPNKHGHLLILFLDGLIFMYALGLGTVPSTITSEILPSGFRGFGGGVATVTMWISNLFFSTIFSSLQESLDPWEVFFIHGIITALILFPIIKLVPTTHGQTVESMENPCQESELLGSTSQSPRP
ncbi:hypothetical protein RGQ29_025867 [Quercus rubra]|nr:hypothetical protein RGQ29_025867 [Quercus rubra]